MNSKWILGEVARRDMEYGIDSLYPYLIHPNPKLDDGEWAIKDINFLFIGMVGQKQRLSCART